jgi:cytochrome P450
MIRKGQTVLLGIAAANRDPAVFADPGRFDIRRVARPHVSFAPGVPAWAWGWPGWSWRWP